ncbi:MAG TPA: glycine--tRNA ligase [Chloroflexota bacterium]|nr:glycine--tRNA ligase [Chloroflexota bacterium]
MAVDEQPDEQPTVTMDKIASLAKRRGFVYGSSEIYGGLSGFWDYGPLGVELKDNIRRSWWRSMVQLRPDVVGLDSATMLPEVVWQASGHLENFTDPLAECTVCRRRFRADDVDNPEVCPECGGRLTQPRRFNTMFKTNVGPIEAEGTAAYLRPETAQGIFLNFKNVLQTTSQKVPFGIAQIGKSYRNEITTGNFVFRSREFEQMEMEFFVRPGTDDQWWEYWKEERLRWWVEELGINSAHLTSRNHEPSELSHYSKQTADIEYAYPFGIRELEGIADRTDYDLKAHMAGSGQDLQYFDPETGEHYVPYVIEPAAGLTRAFLVVLLDAYAEERLGPKPGDVRTVLRLKPPLAPFKVAVFPLSANKPDLVDRARRIYDSLLPHFPAAWDDIGNVGKRYRRQDEVGTPWCVTVDYQTLEDGTVTIRDRDSMQQERQAIDDLLAIFQERLGPR